jgi:hypothetical protein
MTQEVVAWRRVSARRSVAGSGAESRVLLARANDGLSREAKHRQSQFP